MNASQLHCLLHKLFLNGVNGTLNCRINFHDPENRVNLPSFSTEETKGKSGERRYIHYMKGNKLFFLLMTHAQSVNHFESALLDHTISGDTKYPNITIKFPKAERDYNLLEESHRLYAALLFDKDHGLMYDNGAMLNNSKLYELLYSNKKTDRIRAALRHSPCTVLFGGYGSHMSLSKPPSMTSLVQMEINGENNDESIVGKKDKNGSTGLSGPLPIRCGAGSYLPPISISKTVSNNDKDGKTWAEIGFAPVPLNPDKDSNQGAVALKEITYSAYLMFDRLSGIQLVQAFDDKSKNLNAEVRTYLTALWLHMFWLGYEKGFSQYRGRDLVAKEVSFNVTVPPSYDDKKEAVIDEFKHHMTIDNLKPTTCKELYDLCLEPLVKKGLVSLNPECWIASDSLDKHVLQSKQSKKGKSSSTTKN